MATEQNQTGNWNNADELIYIVVYAKKYDYFRFIARQTFWPVRWAAANIIKPKECVSVSQAVFYT